MTTYRAYERVIESAVELPPLADRRMTVAEGSGEPDLRVVREDLPATPDGLDETFSCVNEIGDGSLTAHRSGETVFWFAEGLGTVRVEADGRIAASALPATDGDALADLVVGPGLRTALRLGGDLVVHASAVAVDGRTVAFLGRSGAGKSTAAAACHATGHDVLADDAVAIRDDDDRPTVPTGVTRLDVDRSAREALGLPREGPVGGEAATARTTRPLAALYLLDHGPGFDVKAVSPRRATYALMRATDGLAGPDDAAALAAHQEDAASVVEAVPVRRLVRPRALDRLSELPAVVAEDLTRGDGSRATSR